MFIRFRKFFVWMVSVLFILGGCSLGKNVSSESSNEFPAKIELSNLMDQATQDNLRVLLGNSLPEENIHQFFGQVLHYNALVGDESMVQTGYEALEGGKKLYNSGEIAEKWMEKEPFLPGMNCRLTTYTLLKDKITFKPSQDPDTKLLFMDQAAFDSAEKPQHTFSQEEIQEFNLLFSAVKSEVDLSQEEYIQQIQSYYQSQGIAFDLGDTSMVTVWFLDDLEEDYVRLFVGHVGVLVKDGEGYQFIEKISFEEPYQVLRFETKEDLNTYLMHYYEEENSDAFKPLIFENGQLLETYKSVHSNSTK
ncbi:DUF4300 family protein [Streptococcus cameli]